MKNILCLVAFLLTVSTGFSQKRKQLKRVDLVQLEQRRTLAVKKLTLQLDLNKRQASSVEALMKELSTERMNRRIAERKANMQQREKLMTLRKESNSEAEFRKSVQEELENGNLNRPLTEKMRKRKLSNNFEAKNRALDHMIAMRKGMKNILNETQYEAYKKIQLRNMRVAKQKMEKAKKMKMAQRLKHSRR